MTLGAAPHTRSASEIKAIIELERTGTPFLLWREGGGEQRTLSLGTLRRATVGRASSCDLVLADDREVSRTHAELELIGEEWAVTDDGLSRNGTFLNGARISGRTRLSDGDVVRFGATFVEYASPGSARPPRYPPPHTHTRRSPSPTPNGRY
jgi:predicted component of type VI protein secretion system